MTARSELPTEPERQSPSPLAPGEVVGGKYRIEETVGRGGMAVIYAAHHLVLDQRVAVKVLVDRGATDEVTTERFLREAQAAARLQSEHAARVMDAGVLPTGQPYLVMEYLEGCDLAELLALSGPIEIPELVDYMLQALEGIAHAHAARIVHRDIKPSNLFITVRPDGSNIVKVVDFGISKSTVEHVDPQVSKLTGNVVLGSPAYMSPEQVRNASKVDGRSDVWSLGVSMYELLTGRMPFDGDGVGAILAEILEADPVPVHELRPAVPRELSDAITRCLRRKLEDRWADAGELARAIAPFGTGGWAAYPERIAATLVNARQLRAPTPLGAFAVTSLAALVVQAEVDPLGTTQPPPARTSAERQSTRQAHASTVEVEDRRAITVPGQHRGLRSSRWILVALGMGLAGAAGFVVLRARSQATSEAAPTPATPPVAASSDLPVTSSAILFTTTPPAPATASTTHAPMPSATAAASAHHPAGRGQFSMPSTGTSRPAILHSRN